MYGADMSLAEWDAYLGGIADTTEFILGEKFEEDDGKTLGRILADHHWPNYSQDRLYAKAGDNSNQALRHLQRKYHAALKLLEAAENDQKGSA